MTKQELAAKFFENVMEYAQSTQDLVDNGVSPSKTMFELITEQRKYQTRHGMSKGMINAAMEASAKDGKLAGLDLLPGPWRHATSQDEKIAICQEAEASVTMGNNMYLWAEWQQKYGSQGLSSNIAIPAFVQRGMGATVQQTLETRVLVCDPEDAERIARTHPRKDGSFEPIVFDSIISTTDNEVWQAQRRHLAEVFLPLKTLAEILPISRARAKHCAERLAGMAQKGPVDVSDFLLHEAQAQLQLALLGLDEEFMDKTNADIRSNFMMAPGAPVGKLSEAMAEVVKRAKESTEFSLPSDGRPVKGPLSRAVQNAEEVGVTASAAYGNALLILFAGHDTTGHCMTWLLFELSRHPEYQAELQAEMDAYFASLGGREPDFHDLGRMPFLDRCITETLRLWNSVPNGTFRQLQFDDFVKGATGEEVMIPKGTSMNIVTWSRHRNPDLWGADADEFNPHRHFEPGELTSVGIAASGINPQSLRYSPFVHAPRNCLGRNFAQMEMRLILPEIIKRFSFSLAPPYDTVQNTKLGVTCSSPDDFRGVNLATMGPLDINGSQQMSWGKVYSMGLTLHVNPR